MQKQIATAATATATAAKVKKAAASVLRVSKNVKTYFPRYVGQSDLTLEIAGVIDGIKENANMVLPKYMFDGVAGAGKTELAKAIARALAPEGFEFVEISSHVTLPGFLAIWTQKIEGKKVVVFVDEVHDQKNPKVKNTLKRILETGGQVEVIQVDEDHHITANPFQQIFIVASNMDTTDAALYGANGRFERKTLQPLTEAETKDCIEQMAQDVHLKMHAEAVRYLSGYVMHNPRAIRNLVLDTSRRLQAGATVTIEAAREVVKLSKRYPGGYLQQDIDILQAAKKDGERGRQVAVIASACGGMDTKVCAARIRELEGAGLMVTTTAGRKALAAGGVELLKKLAELAKAALARKAAKKAKKAGGEGEAGATVAK